MDERISLYELFKMARNNVSPNTITNRKIRAIYKKILYYRELTIHVDPPQISNIPIKLSQLDLSNLPKRRDVKVEEKISRKGNKYYVISIQKKPGKFLWFGKETLQIVVRLFETAHDIYYYDTREYIPPSDYFFYFRFLKK